MNSTIAYVVRHGALINPKNILYGDLIEMKLSNKGRNQIRELAQIIKDSNVIPLKIYTSFMERTVESANILGQMLKVSNICFEEKLRDSHVPGVAGKPNRYRLDLHKSGHDEYEGEFLKTGGESREEVTVR